MSQPPFGPPPHGQPSQYPPPPSGQYGPPPAHYGPPPGQYGAPGQYGPPGQSGPPHQYTAVSVAPQQGPSLGWGPGIGQGVPGFQPGWGPQRPKKSKAPVFAILGVVLVAVVGLWTWGVIRKNAERDSYTAPIPTSTRYGSPSAYPSSSPSTEPTDEPTTTEPTSTATEKPKARPIDIAAKNPIYRVGQMRPPNCKEPRIKPNTNGNAAKYWAAVKPCLDRGWAPMITKAGYRFRPPGMTYWAGTSTSNPCGGGAVDVPFYCSANHMMYMKVDVFAKTYNEYPGAADKAYARMWYSRSIAHEYGHAMQEVTGILDASNDLEYEATSAAKRLEYGRRLELQANCFAGMFLAVNKRSYPINGLLLYAWNKWVITAGQPPYEGTHGSKASQRRYMGTSFKTGNPASCNTYKASPPNVS